jgi:hypothetical protein
VLSA